MHQTAPRPSKSSDRELPWQLQSIRFGFRALERLTPALVGPLALRLFRTVRRHRPPARESAWLGTAQRFELPSPDGPLAAWSWGQGPTVALVHGWEGRASQMGAFAEPLVRAGFRAVAFDAPGHGRSPGRTSSLPQFANAVAAVAAEEGPLAAVIAHSFGAAGAGWALAREGLEVERLVFVGAPYDLGAYIHFFSGLVGLSDAGRGRLLNSLQRTFGVDWSKARLATTVGADRRPMLVIHDEADQECDLEGARRIADAWPRGDLMVTRGLGHRRILRDPAVVARAVAHLEGASAGWAA